MDLIFFIHLYKTVQNAQNYMSFIVYIKQYLNEINFKNLFLSY